jgi:hypothetical protein
VTAIVKRLLAWLEHCAHAARQREMDSYLAQAADAADLERRMRELGRRS